jgi:hypothetical protein
MRHEVELEFTSDRFDTTSELPPEDNAGNRFYGRDVAELVANGLGGSYFDEDWGWQTHVVRPDGAVLEVSVYHDGGDDWRLLLRRLEKRRFLPAREVPLADDDVAALVDVFARAGIEFRPGSPEV